VTAVSTGTAADPGTVARLTEEESRRLAEEHPRCAALHERARASMPGGVPMSWMAKWAGPFPLHVT
jgi:glutamate-1-semialdehyde 2,1-aminomutase